MRLQICKMVNDSHVLSQMISFFILFQEKQHCRINENLIAVEKYQINNLQADEIKKENPHSTVEVLIRNPADYLACFPTINYTPSVPRKYALFPSLSVHTNSPYPFMATFFSFSFTSLFMGPTIHYIISTTFSSSLLL